MGILQRRGDRRPLQEYVSPDAIEKLLRETKSEIRQPEVKHFQFVVILANDTNSQEVPGIISTVMGTLFRHHATILDTLPSLFVGLLGVPFPESDSPDARQELVDALLRNNGDRIRIAHGQCDGPVGMFGGDERRTYGALIPGFSEILKKLLEAKFGTAVYVP